MTNTFAFRAGARPVFASAKFRDENEEERICYHITVDPRVARGSVYSHHRPTGDTVKPIKYRPRAIPQPKEEIVDQVEEEEIMEDFRPTLLEIEDRPIEDDLATAADTYIERPPTPHFVPDEPGVDVSTQVYDGDLFNYDGEVRPMIKVIVQHTLLRALAEVHEEVEVENLAKHRDRYEVERNTILAELQRLEAKEQRKFEEDKRRRAQREQVMKEVAELNNRLGSAGFGENYATDVLLHAMEVLERRGFFYDEVVDEVQNVFLPWLTNEVASCVDTKDLLFELRKKAARKANEVQLTNRKVFRKEVKETKKVVLATEKSLFRRMLVEDLGSEKIRNAINEYKAQKAAKLRAKEEEERNESSSKLGETESDA
jgi:hypothetical protein